MRASPLAHAGFCESRKQYLCISVSICGFVFQNFTTGDTENTEIIQIEKIFYHELREFTLIIQKGFCKEEEFIFSSY